MSHKHFGEVSITSSVLNINCWVHDCENPFNFSSCGEVDGIVIIYHDYFREASRETLCCNLQRVFV
ncbi:CLUMA_CG014640, isoform A [Clunio marinus]|uniref:CLUMA_CG014640, isoform A n=1 Tax=Clunio marinus TaxID=568069 RepID=A0A1J1IM28_9DIPT|nr:CLUMA_CG014640, isoform A [Clunio marinus]